jgi:hypothetical protein
MRRVLPCVRGRLGSAAECSRHLLTRFGEIRRGKTESQRLGRMASGTDAADDNGHRDDDDHHGEPMLCSDLRCSAPLSQAFRPLVWRALLASAVV